MRKNSIRTAMLLFCALMASFALASGKITGFEATKNGEGAIIKVNGTDLAQPKLQTAYGGSLAILEFQAVLTGKAEFTRLNTANVTYAKIAQFTAKPPVVRVVAKIRPAANIHIDQSQNGWIISIGATAKSGLNLIEQAQQADQEAFKQAQEALKAGASSKASPNTIGANGTPQSVNVGTKAESPLQEIIEAAKRQDEKMFVEAMRQLRAAKSTTTQPTSPQVDAVTTTAEVKAAAPATVDDQKVSEPILWTANTAGSSAPGSAQRRVSLDFVDTQVVIILKALAEQSGANIVTAPTVQGSISVTLRNVTVQSALDLVTKLAGVRYAYVDGTYIVGSPEFMRSMLIQDTGAASRNGTVMRVVPLASRKAGEIKRAITQAMTMDVLNETIQIINPAAPPEQQQPAASNGQGGAQNGNQSAAPAMEGDADYLILIGEPGRVEQASLLITQLDRGLAGIHGITEVGADALRPVSKAYRVQGGRAAELAAAVEKFATGVSVVATPAGSRAEQSLVITGRPADVDRVLEVLAQIDDVTAGGEWVVEIYDVRHADPRALKAQVEESFETVRVAIGPQSATGRSFTPAAAAGAGGQAGGPLGGASNQGSGGVATSAGFKASPQYGEDETRAVPMMLVVSGPRDQVNQALDMMKKLDRKTPEIVLEARVVDANKEDLLKLGIDWSAVTGSAVKIINLNYGQPAGADGSPFSDITGRFAGPGWLATGIANIDKLVSRDKILARPNVRAMDGREAVVFMGDIVRYIKSIQATQNGITVEVGEEEVGVKLNVLPRVTRDGTIIMEVQPTLSFIKEFLEVPGGGQIPTTSIRTARSTLTIRNGDTIAIGGLITDEDRRQMVGFPILMDIPIIGHLFRRSTTDKVRREIVIFLSARIVEDEEASATQGGAPPSPSNSSGGGR